MEILHGIKYTFSSVWVFFFIFLIFIERDRKSVISLLLPLLVNFWFLHYTYVHILIVNLIALFGRQIHVCNTNDSLMCNLNWHDISDFAYVHKRCIEKIFFMNHLTAPTLELSWSTTEQANIRIRPKIQ